MAYRTRLKYARELKDEIWRQYQQGQALTVIGRSIGRPSSSIYGQLAFAYLLQNLPESRQTIAVHST